MPALNHHVKEQDEQRRCQYTPLPEPIGNRSMSQIIINRNLSLHVNMKGPNQYYQEYRT